MSLRRQSKKGCVQRDMLSVHAMSLKRWSAKYRLSNSRKCRQQRICLIWYRCLYLRKRAVR